MAEKAKQTYSSVFEELAAVDVSKIQQQKGERRDAPKYISWASAWKTVKALFPQAKYEVVKPSVFAGEHGEKTLPDNLNYFNDGKSAWVEVRLIIHGKTDEQIGEDVKVSLPIMDYRNNSIAIDKISQTDVNNTTMRCLTKAIAMAGLGLDMWIKDDVLARLEEGEHTDPMEAEAKKAPAKSKPSGVGKNAPTKNPNKPAPKSTTSLEVLTDTHENWEKVLKYVSTNKSKGIDQIVSDLSKKYQISDEVKVVLKDTIDE